MDNRNISILLSQAESTAAKLKGEGEQEYMKIIAQAYSTPDRVQYYEFIRSLESLKKPMKGEKVIFLPADSYIVRVLNGALK